MKHPKWSKHSRLAALFSLGVATSIASAQAPVISIATGGAGRTPISTQQVPARIPGQYGASSAAGAGNSNPLAPANQPAIFEGPGSTDYLNFQNNFNLLANPQIAVGPEDILLVVNSQIFRVQNGNAPGVVPPTLYPAYSATAGPGLPNNTPNSFQRAFLDQWIGDVALGQLCPTGNPSGAGSPADSGNTRISGVTCLIENATVTYDQMHGRFLVLFTVTDTGLTFNPQSQGYQLTRPRKASWVLMVSRFAVLTDQACLQGTTTTNCGNTTTSPNGAGTFVFITPTPPAGGVTGGVNANLWSIVYGNDVALLGSDGFGNQVSTAVGSTNGPIGAGNLNAIAAISPVTAATVFNCAPTAIYATGTFVGGAATQVCYLPTGARLGVDNDTVTIATAVVNGNINANDSGFVFNPIGTPGLAFQVPDYAGTRIRVIKKTALYTRLFPSGAALAGGNQFAASGAARATGDYYDLYTSPAGDGGTLVTGTNPPMFYTAVASVAPCVAGAVPGIAPNVTRCSPLFYEPAHLRGRAMATYSNSQSGIGAASLSQTYLLGTIWNGPTPTVPNPFFDTNLYVQGIREIFPGTPASPGTGGVFSTRAFYPILQDGTTANILTPIGTPTATPVDGFQNPTTVQQQNYRGGGAAPLLGVGDNRPQVLVFREGHLYDARAGIPLNPEGTFTGGPLLTTVFYDVIQKQNPGAANPLNAGGQGTPTAGALFNPVPAFAAKWQNTTAFAPMFDVPANVTLVGEASPINTLPYLEKLFVSTTYPPLAGSPLAGPTGTQLVTGIALDPYQATAGDPRTRQTFGVSGPAPSQLPAQANCFNYQYSPGPSQPSGGAQNPNNPLAWASLFDIRCGQDVVDSNPQVRNPFSGVVTGQYTYTHRNGAAIDPNDGSLWNFGAYPQLRAASANSLSHWGTFAANYKLSFQTTDPYGNNLNLYNDIAGLPEAPAIMMAANVGLAPCVGAAPAVSGAACTPNGTIVPQNGVPTAPNIAPIPFAGTNTAIYPNASNNANARTPGNAPPKGSFGPNDEVTRREMAYWIIKSQMDESAIDAELVATGGAFSTFADVPTTDPGFRYIELMARRGYTSGCAAGVARRYCPDYIATRKDLAVFMIRAKFNNVFQSVLSGCTFAFVTGTTPPPPSGSFIPPGITTNCTGGDNFGLFTTALPYFTDNPLVTGNDAYVFLQKMRELRITNGTSLGPNLDGRNGTYGTGTFGIPASLYDANPPVGVDRTALSGNLLRKQVATFMIRGFFF